VTVVDWAEAAVKYGVVPGLLGIGVLTAGVSAGQVWPKARSAAYGGFWAGTLCLFAWILVFRSIPLWRLPIESPSAPAWAFFVGVITGSLTTFSYIRLRHRKWVALPLGAQAFGSLGLLYTFIGWPLAASAISWLAIGVAITSSVFYALHRDYVPRAKRRDTGAARWSRPRTWHRPRPFWKLNTLVRPIPFRFTIVDSASGQPWPTSAEKAEDHSSGDAGHV
jgi:hypothetical protein